MSYQTVKLEQGPHAPGQGRACVMEVVSMLAHEKFSDMPECTCPVIAGMLQSINDSATDEQRQALWPYTTAVVGTRDGKHLERLHKLEAHALALPHKAAEFFLDAADIHAAKANDLGYLCMARNYAWAIVTCKGRQAAIDILDSLLPETEEIPAEELIAVKRELAAA